MRIHTHSVIIDSKVSYSRLVRQFSDIKSFFDRLFVFDDLNVLFYAAFLDSISGDAARELGILWDGIRIPKGELVSSPYLDLLRNSFGLRRGRLQALRFR